MAALHRVTAENWAQFAALLRWRATGERHAPQPCEAPAALVLPQLQVWAVEDEGTFVGWISLAHIPKVSWTTRGHLYVDELWVAEGFRRQGHGRMLMEKAEEVAQEMGVVGLRLYVNAENAGARKLYEGCGFAAQGSAEWMEKEIRLAASN